MIGAEKNRAGTTRDAWLAQEIARSISGLQDHLAAVEDQIATREPLAEAGRRLRSVPGIGPMLAAVLIAWLPEPGRLNHRRIAALAGLAPHSNDSGQRLGPATRANDLGLSRGKRHVRGGRPGVRRAPSLAAFIALRYGPVLKAFRKRLRGAGKPTQTAITACARKPLTILNAMMRDGKDDVKQAAQRRVPLG